MNYGYVRVSTTEQNIDRQVRAMEEKGIENIFVDKFTGINFEDRPNWQRLKRRLKKGDVLFIKSLDRLGRKYTLVLEEWRWLSKRGIAVVVMDMPILDTRTQGGGKNLMGKFIADLVLQVLSFVAEQEYRNIHERQRQGIEAAKAAGVRFGRPRHPVPDSFWDVVEDCRKGKISIPQAAKRAAMPQSSFYGNYQRYLKGDLETEKEPLPICPYMKRAPNMLDCLQCDSSKCSMEDEKEDFEFREPYQRVYNSEIACAKAKELRERRKAEGLCPTCGLRPPEEGKKHCRECLDRANGYYRYKQIKKARMRGEDDA